MRFQTFTLCPFFYFVPLWFKKTTPARSFSNYHNVLIGINATPSAAKAYFRQHFSKFYE